MSLIGCAHTQNQLQHQLCKSDDHDFFLQALDINPTMTTNMLSLLLLLNGVIFWLGHCVIIDIL